MMTHSKQSVTQCQCGYTFAYATPFGRRKFKSFAVVNDKDYQRFLKSEVKVLAALNAEAKMRAIAKSSQYVGALMECPECKRVLLTLPDQSPRAYYPVED
jgi:hypothetical protein